MFSFHPIYYHIMFSVILIFFSIIFHYIAYNVLYVCVMPDNLEFVFVLIITFIIIIYVTYLTLCVTPIDSLL